MKSEGRKDGPRALRRPEGIRRTGAASLAPFLHFRPHFRSSEAFGPLPSGPDRSACSAPQSRPALGPDPHPRIPARIFLSGPAPVPSSVLPANPRSEPTAHHSPTPAPSSSRPALATFLKALPLCPFAPFLKCITCFRKLLQNSFQLQVTYNAILVSAAQQYLDVYRVYKGVPP